MFSISAHLLLSYNMFLIVDIEVADSILVFSIVVGLNCLFVLHHYYCLTLRNNLSNSEFSDQGSA